MRLRSLFLFFGLAAMLTGCKHSLTSQQLDTLEGRDIYFAKVGSAVEHDPNEANFGLLKVSTATVNRIADTLSKSHSMRVTSETFYLSEDDFNRWDGFDRSYLNIIEKNPDKHLTGVLIQTGYLSYRIDEFGGTLFDERKIVKLQLPIHIVDMLEKKRIGFNLCQRTYVVFTDQLDPNEKHLPVYKNFSDDCSAETLSQTFGLSVTK